MPVLLGELPPENFVEANITPSGEALKGAKKVKGFQTGDSVRAVVTTGTKQGYTSGASWCVPVGPSMSKPTRGASRGSAITS
ncbi:MAG TPA: hypothetical protein VN729_01620 [Ktedonobacteraceae bacterium]|nr:hypothetical protein [Ktedonobacteraceae bacterium]